MKNWKAEKDTIYDIITLLRQRSHGKEVDGLPDRSLFNGAANIMESMIRDLLDTSDLF